MALMVVGVGLFVVATIVVSFLTLRWILGSLAS